MTRLALTLTFAAVAATIWGPMPPAVEVDRPTFLAAIAARESHSEPGAIGLAGERSAYQFTAATWRFHTDAPFELATFDAELAHWVAEQHFEQLKKELRNRRVPVRPETLAAAWNKGSAKARRYYRSAYAKQVANLYWDALSRRTA
mgnify:CR=1 FL=1